MNQQTKRTSGFTLVELLIVIVVISILATISIVSYTGVQARARATKAKMNAASVKKVAEAYYAQNNAYPTASSHFRSGIITLPSTVLLLTSGSLSGSNGEDSIMYRYVGTAPNATGACVLFWDFAPSGGGAAAVSSPSFLGTATSANCSASLGQFPSA